MDNTWIKLYRKLLNRDDFFKARYRFEIFVFLLLLADRDGVIKMIGRNMISDWLKVKPSSVYKTLKWLQKGNEIVMESNNRGTAIRIVNWSKYQANPNTLKNGVSESNNKVTAKEQQSNTIQEYRYKNKDKDINNNIIADKPQSSPKTKVYTRLPEDKRQLLHRVAYHLEDVLHTQIVNWGKQGKAVKLMERAGYTERQICWVIDQMAKEEFYQDKGFDLMTVANSIAQYKARARKGVDYVLSEAN